MNLVFISLSFSILSFMWSFVIQSFEGKTMLPVIRQFVETNEVTLFTVVADAAMMGLSNLKEIEQNGWRYLVGARVANLSRKMIEQIAEKLEMQDGKTIRLETAHGDLICSFSQKRLTLLNNSLHHSVSLIK